MTITFFRISVYVEESHLSKRTMVGPMNVFFFFQYRSCDEPLLIWLEHFFEIRMVWKNNSRSSRTKDRWKTRG